MQATYLQKAERESQTDKLFNQFVGNWLEREKDRDIPIVDEFGELLIATAFKANNYSTSQSSTRIQLIQHVPKV